jgi:hypothetical protein
MVKNILKIKEGQEAFEKLYSELLKVIESCKYSSEAKLRQLTEERINGFLRKFGIDLTDVREYEAGSIGLMKVKGRTDALYSNLVIEFKKHNLLSSNAELKSAIKQIREQYLEKIDEERKPNFVGIVFDGKKIVFVKYDIKNKVWLESIRDFSENSLFDWILLLVGVKKKQVHPTLLRRDFAIDSSVIRKHITVLYKKLCSALDNGHERAKVLFNEWDKTFRYIYGGILDETKLKSEFEGIIKSILIDEKNIKVDRFLFVLYSYYAFIIKLFASEIACINLKMYPEAPIRLLINSKNIEEDLRYIEEGLFFKDYMKIDNYIEGGFFSWYLDVFDDDIETEIKNILKLVNEYDPQSFIHDEHVTRDLLKNLFQDIVPQRIRHDLGEYYTPDWLIQLAVEEAGYKGKPDEKVLDPGCGSGGFIIEFINRIKKSNGISEEKLKPKILLDRILNNIVGFDVNPVAVLTARTNYLIAISDLLQATENEPITIPIYLTDSIITPTIGGKGTLLNDSYKLKTVVGTFSIPKSIVTEKKLDKLLSVVEETVPQYYPTDDFIKLLTKEVDIDKKDIKEISEFYDELVDLHKSDRNKIWVKIIQNSFAPLLYSKFDYVIGNPPWIKWDFLSNDYKEKLRILYQDVYKLFSHKGMKASMGYAHDDLSILFTYIAMDKYLKDKGVLSFVLKQTLYKSIAGKEFRKFQITKKNAIIPIEVKKVHDLLDLKPFGSGAETSIAVLKKNEKTNYPVSYEVWTKDKKGTFDELSTLNYIKSVTKRKLFDAYPDPFSGDINDVWILAPKGVKLPKIPNRLNYYIPRHGVVNDLNSVFLLDIKGKSGKYLSVTNLANIGRKKVKEIKADLEPDYIYPLIKPNNTKRWHIDGYFYMLLPQKKDGENNESHLRVKFNKTYSFLSRFKNELLSRKSKWFKGEGKPFYSIFGIGEYTFKPYKIVWCCMSYKPDFSVVSKVNDKLIGNKEVIPDNTIGNISFDSKDEAHFVCSVLNSEKAELLFSMRSSKSKWGISIDMVKKIPVPQYNPKDKNHKRLAELSQEAHKLSQKGESKELEKIEKEINKLVGKIF